jgi:hypothetical protein
VELLLPLLFLLSQCMNRLLHLRRRTLLGCESAHPNSPHSTARQAEQLRLVGTLQVKVWVSESRQLMVLDITLQLVRGRRGGTHLRLQT